MSDRTPISLRITTALSPPDSIPSEGLLISSEEVESAHRYLQHREGQVP
jgi:hypothetical protein